MKSWRWNEKSSGKTNLAATSAPGDCARRQREIRCEKNESSEKNSGPADRKPVRENQIERESENPSARTDMGEQIEDERQEKMDSTEESSPHEQVTRLRTNTDGERSYL
jgi:hypothetical protein